MTSYVQTGEEDLGLELARLIDTLHAPTSAAAGSGKDTAEETKEQPAEDNETPSMKHVINADYPELYQTGFFSSAAVQHLQQLDASTYDALFTLSFAIIDRIEDERKQTDIVRKLVDLITTPAESSKHSTVKLRLLVNLFNQFYAGEQAQEEVPSRESKVIHSDITMDLLYRALQFAVSTKQYASVQPQLAKHIPEWFGTSVSPAVDETAAAPSETQSEIYLLTYQIYQHAAENATLAQQRQSLSNEADNFLYLYLQSLNHATSQQSLQQGVEYARAAALRSISQPLSSTISIGGAKAKAITNAASNTVRVRPLDSQRLLQLTVVQQLSSDKKNPTNAQLYQLLQTVAKANVQQYQELTRQHPQLLQSVGLNAEAILSKLRTLALCQMGLNQTSVQIERVRQELNLKDDVEVEEAVIAAIVSGRLDAKIDEEQSLIKIKRVTGVNRWAAAAQKQQESKEVDGEEMQWSSLSTKLQSWRTNVTAVLNTMHASSGHFAPELEASAEE